MPVPTNNQHTCNKSPQNTHYKIEHNVRHAQRFIKLFRQRTSGQPISNFYFGNRNIKGEQLLKTPFSVQKNIPSRTN